MKKGWLIAILLSMINFASAYGGSTNLYIGNFYINPELLFFAITFCLIFAATTITLTKVKIIKNPAIIAIFFSLFAIYGLFKINLDIESLYVSINIAEFLINYGVLIFAAVLVFIIIKWDFGTALEFLGSIFLLLAVLGAVSQNAVEHWIVSLIIGVVLFLIGMAMRKKYSFKQKRNMINWRKAGRKMGYGMAKKYSHLQDYIQRLRKRNKKEEKQIQQEIKELQKDQRKNPENKSADKTRLTRLYGIKNLEIKMDSLIKELNNGYNIAEDLHKRASRLGWTSVGRVKRKPNEEIKPEDNQRTRREKEKLFQRRAKDANEAYKTWYRQYQKNIMIEKQISEIENRINYLKNKI